MGFFDFLFGSEEESKTETSTRPTTTLTPEQQNALNLILSSLSLGPLASQYPNFGPMIGRREGEVRRDFRPGLDTLRSLMTITPGAFDEALERYQIGANKDFTRFVQPAIRSGYGDSGLFSSSRMAAERQGIEDFEQDLLDARSKYALGMIGQQRELAGTYGDFAGKKNMILADLLRSRLAGAQGKDEAARARLQAILQALAIPAFENIVFQNTNSKGGSPGLLGSFLGGIGSGLFGG